PQWDVTERIGEHEARPGDLVFFANTWASGISHVGIYMGAGMMLHAPTEGKVVEIVPIHDDYWGAHLAGFGRVP
ncbi:MAG TPA: NlpC/P60 family protein, partial [Thermomicrobiales bacterium]|nr:NlpC/P60 family protein [Thermomicrobiales bacterium]